MRLWLDTTSTHHTATADDCSGGSDAECHDCSLNLSYSTFTNLAFIEEDLQQIYVGTFQQSTPLHLQECAHERWLVCNPIGVGQVAVLDAQAVSLLEQFRTPRSLLTVMRDMSQWSTESIEKAIASFYKLGFLQNPALPSVQRESNDFQTLSAWLHITNACNLRCHYCYLHKTSESMADDTAYRAVDAIFRSARKQQFKYVRLKYAGGEASLHMSRVIAIHDYATQQAQNYDIGFSAYLMSNGVALSQRTIDHLKARNIDVMISLDGIGEHHDSQRPFSSGKGSFTYVNRTINQLLTNHIFPHISVTVSQRNLAGLPDLIEYILEREMPFTLNYYRDNECSTHLADLQFGEAQLISAMRSVFGMIEQTLPKRRLLGSLIDKANLQTPHRHTCGVGNSYLVIDQNGGIAKCQADIKRTVTTIDADDPLSVIRKDRTGVQGLSVEDKQGCRTCQWRYWCTGGCPLLTYRMTGRYDLQSPNCNIYQALFPEVLRLEALRLLKYESPMTL